MPSTKPAAGHADPRRAQQRNGKLRPQGGGARRADLAGGLAWGPNISSKTGAGPPERQTARDDDHVQRLIALKGTLADAEERRKRPYQAIENGVADPSGPTLKERNGVVKTERGISHVALTRAAAAPGPEARIPSRKIAVAVEAMRANARQGPVPFRRAYLQAMIDDVEG